MSHPSKMRCDLCRRSKETKVTGALSAKAQVTAHQNCLLFSSGIYCQNSPHDDLFGFTIDDVINEVKRGSKLNCSKCGMKGATAGCEVKRCKKSYHYPCAIKEGAIYFEDPDKGNYGLYCSKHSQQAAETNGLVNGRDSYSTTYGTSKKRYPDDSSTGAGSFDHSANSDSSSSTHAPIKRHLSFPDKGDESPCKQSKCGSWTRQISDDSSKSDENEPNTDREMFAPIETDFEESANSAQEQQCISNNEESTTSGNPLEEESSTSSRNKDETIHSDAESESLLPPVKISIDSCQSLSTRSLAPPTLSTAHPNQILVEAVVENRREVNSQVNMHVGNTEGATSPIHSPDQLTSGPSEPPPSPDPSKSYQVTGSPPCPSSAISPAPPMCFPPCSAYPCVPEPSIDSPSFWKSCNASGCTQAIFTDFSNEINGISSRIQSEQASQEDYDLALKVMSASGKLTEFVAKHQKALEQKQMELKKAEAALKKVVSALGR